MTDNFVKDPAFRTALGGAFEVMLEAERYASRTARFDGAIARSHDHFWDPNDPAYIDFAQPFDLDRDALLPESMFPELGSPALADLDASTRVALINENARWLLSGILHGEQAAMSLCASLAGMLVDPGTQEFVTNQAREESRHVSAFGTYIAARWGSPYPPGETLGGLLKTLVETDQVYRKLVGMQILVEGLAMSLFTVIQMVTGDPVLKRLTQLVITDESFHHSFGKAWADSTVQALDPPERDAVEDWAADVFAMLVTNLVNVREKRAVYAKFGLDWRTIAAGAGTAGQAQWQQAGSIFRYLAKALTKAGIITARTRGRYAVWLDLDKIESEEDFLEFVGELVAMQGVEMLQSINRTRTPIGRTAPLAVAAE